MYNVDIHTLIKLLLPVQLRKAHVTGLLYALMMPVQVLHNALISYRNRKRYEMAITPQVIYLEKILNDKFNQLGAYPDIYITDNSDLDDIVYMGNAAEDDSAVYLGNKWRADVYYYEGDEVIYDDLTWVCMEAYMGSVPFEGSAIWERPSNVDEPVPYIGNNNEYNLGNQFTVHINQAHWNNQLSAKVAEISATINKYKTYGSTYKYIQV